MPDHLHLLVGNETGQDVIKFVRHFKQATGFAFKRMCGSKLWQDRFYDHAIRRSEDVEKVEKYIWDNPVQAGLVKDGEDYPYSGSLNS